MNAPWDDDDSTTTRTREREYDEVDLEPTAIVHRQQQHVQRSELDFASLCEIAQGMGPRDRTQMIALAREAGAMLGAQLNADGNCAAYYSWTQGGKLIEGPTIDMMEALGDVWGRLAKSIELVEETPTRVEMRGVVVDLLTLTITRRPFVGAIMPAPRKFAKSPEQRARWHALQIASNASKAIRGTLEHALPAWLVEPAVAAGKVAHAKAVLGGATLEQVVPRAVGYLGEQYGLDEQVLVAWLEVPRDGWTLAEVARLRALAEDLKSGRTTVAAVREVAQTSAPPVAASDDRLAGLGLGTPAAAPPQAPPPAPASAPAPPAEPSDPDQAERARLIAELQFLSASLPLKTRESLRDQHGMIKIRANDARIDKLRLLIEATKRAIADAAATAWDDPGHPLEPALSAEIEDLEASLADDECAAAAKVAGIPVNETGPVLDGAPEPWKRRYLHELRARA